MGGASAGRMAPGQGGPGPRTGRAGGSAGAAARPPGSHRRREWRARPRRRRPPPPPGPAPASAPPIPAPARPRLRLGPANPRAAPRLGHAPARSARPCEGGRRPLAAQGRSPHAASPLRGTRDGADSAPAEPGRGRGRGGWEQQRGCPSGITLPPSRSPLSSPRGIWSEPSAPQRRGPSAQPPPAWALPSGSDTAAAGVGHNAGPPHPPSFSSTALTLRWTSLPNEHPGAGEQRPRSGDTGMLSSSPVAASPGPCLGTDKPSQDRSTSTDSKKNHPEGRSPGPALPTHHPGQPCRAQHPPLLHSPPDSKADPGPPPQGSAHPSTRGLGKTARAGQAARAHLGHGRHGGTRNPADTKRWKIVSFSGKDRAENSQQCHGNESFPFAVVQNIFSSSSYSAEQITEKIAKNLLAKF